MSDTDTASVADLNRSGWGSAVTVAGFAPNTGMVPIASRIVLAADELIRSLAAERDTLARRVAELETALEAAQREAAAKQAQIDELMLEALPCRDVPRAIGRMGAAPSGRAAL